MADRDVSAVVIAAIERVLDEARCPNPRAAALKIRAVLDGHNIRLAVPAHHHDPNADWHQHPPTGDVAAGIAAVRQALHDALNHQENP